MEAKRTLLVAYFHAEHEWFSGDIWVLVFRGQRSIWHNLVFGWHNGAALSHERRSICILQRTSHTVASAGGSSSYISPFIYTRHKIKLTQARSSPHASHSHDICSNAGPLLALALKSA